MIARTLPLSLFALSLFAIVFGMGIAVAHYQLFPYRSLHAAAITARTMVESWQTQKEDLVAFAGLTDVPAAETRQHRIKPLQASALDRPILHYGGRHQFRELCPENGCLAVEFSPEGKVVHAYPYRPREIFSSNSTAQYSYEDAIGFDFASSAVPFSITRFSNGDLLVIFQTEHTFPFGNGVARIDRTGHPVWFRRDYSHHFATLLDDDRVLVPGVDLVDGPIEAPMYDDHVIELRCERRVYDDEVRVIDGTGSIIRKISVLDAMLDSPFRAALAETTDPCDPLHLNFTWPVDEEFAAAVDGLDPGDIMVSLRNISSIGFLDGRTGELKWLHRGTFFQQHAVQHLSDGKVLLFDNQGGDTTAGPSRLLMIDLAKGEEVTIFPNQRTPEEFRNVYSHWAGNVDVAPERDRALVSFTIAGKAFEVSLPDGELLTVIDNVHDVSDIESLAEERFERAGRFYLYGIDYMQEEKE